jgi:mannose-6-phosphate isomerase
MTTVAPLLLRGTVQNSQWGRVGSDSRVALLLDSFEPDVPYAELWVGAHPKSPSRVLQGGVERGLDQLIAEDRVGMLGHRVVQKFGALPFLFKILSIGSALSIQAHPDRERAAALHQRDPKNYPDANHKPEVGIALTDVELLCGFREVKEIAALTSAVPEFGAILGAALCDRFSSDSRHEAELLKSAYSSIVQSEPELRATQMGKLIARVKSMPDGGSKAEQLVCRLSSLHQLDDIGLFSCFLLNICTLKPGEAIWIEPNLPHAYLSGDIVECMANSDNVVRAGLTSKFQDIPTLVEMLSYTCASARIVQAKSSDTGRPAVDGVVLEYPLPAEEFSLKELRGAVAYRAQTLDAVALVFQLEGAGAVEVGTSKIVLHQGQAALVPASAREYGVLGTAGARSFVVTVP